ncbi:EAL domain-containing protein [Roseibium sp.]|uniref:EAL domain-containing protein n=1 Tax=Roseibium sp. TaxID=1936156 RepID=UPI003A97C4AC
MGKSRRGHAIGFGALPLLAFAAIVFLSVQLFSMGALAPFARTFDEIRLGLSPQDPSGQILIVDIDARSLNEVGVWPWPRSYYADIIDRLLEGGAEEIAFDVDFSTRSTPYEDAVFASALERAEGKVSLATFHQDAIDAADGEAELIVNKPIDDFAQHIWPALVSVPIEQDGRVWRSLRGDLLEGEPVMALAALLAGVGGDLTQPFYIDYGIDPAGFKRISAVDILAERANLGVVAGKKVLIGASAQELRDLFSVPVHEVLPGAVIQALAAESLILGRDLKRAGGEFLLGLTVLLVFPILFCGRFDWKLRAALMVALSAGLEVGAMVLHETRPVLLQTEGAQVALLLLFGLMMAKQIGLVKILLRVSQIQTRNSRMVLGRVFEDSFDGILVVDSKAVIQIASRSAARILCAPVKAGQLARTCLPDEIYHEILEALTCCDDDTLQAKPREVHLKPADGTERIIEFVVTVSRQIATDLRFQRSQASERLATVTCRDVTDQRKATRRLAYLAGHDRVTGLINEASFSECVDAACAVPKENGRTFCIALIAVDGMDRIIASLGFSIRNHLRKALAERLDDAAETDAVIASVSENRLGLLISARSEEDILDQVHEVFEALSGDYTLTGSRIPVSISIGYALICGDVRDSSIPLRDAGNALSLAMRSGGNRVLRFEDVMHTALERRRTLEIELVGALQKHEIHVVYQPLVDLSSSTMIGVEALMRWEHNVLGFVSPAEFIPIAEESGRILELGGWILRQAMRDAMTWPAELRLAVNVSAVQFAAPGFIDVVRTALSETGFPASRLDLELTESLFVDERMDIGGTISALKALGCSLALDDFGTGYSSLGYIPRFPFSKIKIDKSFVDDVCSDEPSAAIVSSVVHLAESFGMTVVAEGIETEDQERKLRELGCDIGQGYLLGRPMQSIAIAERLRQAEAERLAQSECKLRQVV